MLAYFIQGSIGDGLLVKMFRNDEMKQHTLNRPLPSAFFQIGSQIPPASFAVDTLTDVDFVWHGLFIYTPVNVWLMLYDFELALFERQMYVMGSTVVV